MDSSRNFIATDPPHLVEFLLEDSGTVTPDTPQVVALNLYRKGQRVQRLREKLVYHKLRKELMGCVSAGRVAQEKFAKENRDDILHEINELGHREQMLLIELEGQKLKVRAMPKPKDLMV